MGNYTHNTLHVCACVHMCVCVCLINCTYVRKNSRKKCNKCIYCLMAVPSLEQDFSPPGSWNYFGNWWVCSAKVSFRYLQTLEETLSPRWPTNNLKNPHTIASTTHSINFGPHCSLINSINNILSP